MQPLKRGTLIRPPIKKWIKDCIASGLPRQEAKLRYHEMELQEVWLNSDYVVLMHRNEDVPSYMNRGKFPNMVWLSLRRQDREPIYDWRDMQAIKNQLIGPECEMVQLFPAESRLVDSANQYHFFGCTSPAFRFPFGFPNREVTNIDFVNTCQRPFEESA